MEVEITYGVVEVMTYQVRRECRRKDHEGSSIGMTCGNQYGTFDSRHQAEAVAEALERMEAAKINMGM